MDAAALCGFGRLSKTTLHALAKHLHAPLESGASLSETIKALVKHILPGTPDALLVDILFQRMAADDVGHSEVFENEFFLDNLDKSDKEEVEAFACKAKTARAEMDIYSKEVCQLAATIYAAKSGGKAIAVKAGRGGAKVRSGGASSSRAGALPLPADQLSEAEANAYMPEGSRVHKDVANNRWRASCSPGGLRSRSWPLYGEKLAFALVCDWAWQQTAPITMKENPHVWIKDLVAAYVGSA